MSSENKNSPVLTPTYQTVLINALNTAVTRMLERDHKGTYDALKTLHSLLTPEMLAEIKPVWDKYITEIRKIKVNVLSRDHYFILKGYEQLERLTYRHLFEANPPMIQEFIRVLHKFGYLEKIWNPLSDKSFSEMEEEGGESE